MTNLIQLQKAPFTAAAQRRTMPILGYGLVADRKITYTNLEQWIAHDIDYSGPDFLLEIALIEKAFKVDKNPALASDGTHLDAGGVSIPIPASNVEDFPECDFNFKAGVGIVIPELAAGIKQVQYAAATQDVRYYLNGICLEIAKGVVKLIATDGHRMAWWQCEAESTLPDQQHIIPIDALKYLDGDTVHIGDHCMEVGQLRTKLIQGLFPDYRRVVPKKSTATICLDRCELHASLKKLMPLVDGKYKGLKLNVSQDQLEVVEPKTGASMTLVAKVPKDFKIEAGYNAEYLLDSLAACPKGQVAIEMTDANSVILVGRSNLVMPMRI